MTQTRNNREEKAVDLNFVRGHFTKSELESAIIGLFQEQDYDYVLGETIRRGFEDILLKDDLRFFLAAQYPDLTAVETDKVVGRLENITSAPLYFGNREAFLLVSEGFDPQRDAPGKIALHINYIDFDLPENNTFKVVSQYSVQGERLRRPDLILFINGIPVAIFEFKSAIKENTAIHDAWEQITSATAATSPS
jgi:type I restriction enzyme R subunit